MKKPSSKLDLTSSLARSINRPVWISTSIYGKCSPLEENQAWNAILASGMSLHLQRVDTIQLCVNQNAIKPTHQLCEPDSKLHCKEVHVDNADDK